MAREQIENQIPGSFWDYYHPRYLAARFQRSLRKPGLIGEDAGLAQYLKIQWCIIVWRLLVPLQIPAIILFDPGILVSVDHALLLFASVMLYAIAYGWLCRLKTFAGRPMLHLLDQLICASFLMIAHDVFLVNVLVVYAMSSIIARPSLRFRDHISGVVILSASYLLASQTVANDNISISQAIGFPVIFLLLGISYWKFSRVIYSVSVLELQKHIGAQRKKCRRRLHDDLGNLICGMHLKIESLKLVHRNITGDDLSFLGMANLQAEKILNRLTKDLDDQPAGLVEKLLELRRQFAGNGFEVQLEYPQELPELSPEITEQVSAVLKEALSNALRHSGSSRAWVKISSIGGNLRFRIIDDGDGFEVSETQRASEAGHYGLKGMSERARMIQGELSVNSQPGKGTIIELELEIGELHERRRNRFFRWFAGNGVGPMGEFYQFLVKIRLLVCLVSVLRWICLPGQQRYDYASVAIITTLILEAFAWYIFREQLLRIITRRPWLLLIEQVYYGVFFYLTLSHGVDMFFDDAPTYALVFSAYYLSAFRNVGLALFQGIAFSLAYILADAFNGPGGMEDLVWNIAANLAFAMAGGLMIEFIRSLEALQKEAITGALQDHHARLSMIMHDGLWDQVQKTGAEIGRLSEALEQNETVQPRALGVMEKISSETKVRLRNIMNYLEGEVV